MSKKLTQSEVEKIFKDGGCELLGEYNNSKTKVKYLCGCGNISTITVGSFKRGSRCKICLGDYNSVQNKQNKFIKKARLVHNDKYDYSKVHYVNYHKKVTIICKKHGEFLQAPSKHLFGQGCLRCYREKVRLNSIKKFIKMSKSVHGDKYDYSKVVHCGVKGKVTIICQKHGEFKQRMDIHMDGHGCPKCAGYFKEQYFTKNIPRYELFEKIFTSVGINCRRNKDDYNVLDIKCHLCKKWFTPSHVNAHAKKQCINGKMHGEYNLYCSDKCKNLCPTFGFNPSSIDPRSKLYIDKTEVESARACATSVIKQLQCSSDGKLHCERCGNEIYGMDAELHHTLPVAKYGMKASDHESQILLCTKCHLELHNECK